MSDQADTSGQSPSSPQVAGPDQDAEADDEATPAGGAAAPEGYEPL